MVPALFAWREYTQLADSVKSFQQFLWHKVRRKAELLGHDALIQSRRKGKSSIIHRSAELVAEISSIVDSFIQNDLLCVYLVDVPRMVIVWSNASLARDPSDLVVAVIYEDSWRRHRTDLT